MHILSLDCEYNQPSQKTIQIGAAVFKTETGEMLDSMEVYVNPYESIQPFITELTGITDEDVVTGMDIKDAFNQLRDFHAKHRCFMNILCWGSGVRNDADVIYKEADPRDEEGNRLPNFMGFRVIDAKTIYQSVQIFHGGTLRGGLESACKKVGIDFVGDAHRARNDAINTYRIYHYLMKKFQK